MIHAGAKNRPLKKEVERKAPCKEHNVLLIVIKESNILVIPHPRQQMHKFYLPNHALLGGVKIKGSALYAELEHRMNTSSSTSCLLEIPKLTSLLYNRKAPDNISLISYSIIDTY